MLATDRLREPARILLACVRLLMGLLGLLAPGIPARQIGVDPEANPGILYIFRMFGIRTVLIGAELLMQTGDRRGGGGAAPGGGPAPGTPPGPFPVARPPPSDKRPRRH